MQWFTLRADNPVRFNHVIFALTLDVICPPQYPEACYLIYFTENKTPKEAHELCKSVGTLLWLPVSDYEEVGSNISIHITSYNLCCYEDCHLR